MKKKTNYDCMSWPSPYCYVSKRKHKGSFSKKNEFLKISFSWEILDKFDI